MCAGLLVAALALGVGSATSARAEGMTPMASIDPSAGIRFDERAAQLSDEALDTLALHAERLKRDPDTSLTLVGHPDKTGSPSYGVALAQRLATLVEEALIAMGVDPRRIHATVAGTGAVASCQGACAGLVEFRYRRPEAPDYRASIRER